MRKCLGQLMEEIRCQFKTKNQKYNIICFSLVYWQDGYWSIKVTDDWHKWIDEGIEEPSDLYETPEGACEGFLEFVKDNKIKLKDLQSDD